VPWWLALPIGFGTLIAWAVFAALHAALWLLIFVMGGCDHQWHAVVSHRAGLRNLL
jgi:hypothetical protein